MSRKRRQIELPHSYVEGRPPEGEPSIPPGYSGPLPPLGNNPHGDWFRDLKSGSKEAKEQQALFNKAPYAMKAADDEAKSEYVTQLAMVAQRIELDAQALRQSLGGQPQAHIEVLRQDVNVRNMLVERKTLDLNRHRTAANSYFGSTPFGKSPVEYAVATYRLSVQMRLRPPALEQALKSSYRAAYSAQLSEAEIQILQAQIGMLHQAIANAESQALAQAQAEAEAAARAQAEAEAAVRAQAEAEAAARAQAEAEAAARAQAEAEAAARAQAEAEAAAQAQAEVEANRLANTFTMSGSIAIGGPLVVTAVGHVVSTALNMSLSASIGAALAALRGAAAGVVVPFVAGASALLYSSRLGNGELPDRYVLQMPLETLDLQIGLALAPGNAIGSHAELPYRFSSQATEDGDSEILVVKTDGQVVPSQVRVLAATHDLERNLYNVTTADVPPRTFTWTPIKKTANASTNLPAEQPEPAIYEGATLTPVEVRIDDYPGVADASLDDYIIVFPADSGLPPLYVMFKDRREEPGTMTGFGQPDATIWLAGANQGQGVAIPPRIADKLRGRNFSNWRRAREAIWTAVSEDAILMSQFSKSNQTLLRNAYAPSAIPSEHAGSNRVFEIHHVIPLKDGGAVYDIDNLRITTPKNHVRIHRNKGANQ
ncbi:S-type pyocin [Pseudomonas sp. CC120222-01a]|nr:S-type pyocin [Pseudomonas sp. CC120222-01a]